MDLSAFNLQGEVALITGGAHGIGFSIAEGMAKCGAVICFNCSSEASLEKGMAAYKAAGIDAHGYVADVSDEDAVNAMVAKIKAEVGPVDILVNNAGLMKRVPMIEMSHADFMRVIDVHVGGAFNCSKAVLPDMMEKREGMNINVTIDTASHRVTLDGEEIYLTPKEFDLLLLFARNKNRALYRETIYETVWGGEYMGQSRTVDLHVQRLKKKLHWENIIIAVYKVGYRLNEVHV